EPRVRRVGVAVLLGILVPGLGQAYGGDVRRAGLWFLGAVGLGTLTIRAMLTVQRPPFNLALPISLLFAYYVVEIVDAAVATPRARPVLRSLVGVGRSRRPLLVRRAAGGNRDLPACRRGVRVHG